jgi:Fanconi-associated nuclease 1
MLCVIIIVVRYFSAIQLEERIVTFISDKSIVPLEVSKIAEKAMEILSLEQSRDLYENDTFSKGSPKIKTTTTKDNIIDLTDDDDGGDDGGYIYSCSEPSVTFWSHFTAGYVCVQVLIYCVECYEKLRDYKRANELLVLCLSQDKYSHRRRGKWWERLILNLHYHLNQPNQCLSQIKVALEDPTIYDSTRYSLLVRAHKICSSTNLKKSIKYTLNDFPPITIKQQPEIFITGIQQPNTPYFIVQDGDTSSLHSVEGFAIHHYTKVSKWLKGLHLEGICFSSLYMLLMWDAIFTHEVPDVFRGPYQSIPLDFGGSGFYHTRKKLIDPLIEMVKSFSLQELSLYITSKWTEHFGETVMGINWDAFPNGSDDLVVIFICYSWPCSHSPFTT